MNAPAATPTAIDLRPEYGNWETLLELFGLAQTTARDLERDGEIKFARIKRKGNVAVGKVLVNLDSVRAYLQRSEAPK